MEHLKRAGLTIYGEVCGGLGWAGAGGFGAGYGSGRGGGGASLPRIAPRSPKAAHTMPEE
jgi:hypothetical protein